MKTALAPKVPECIKCHTKENLIPKGHNIHICVKCESLLASSSEEKL